MNTHALYRFFDKDDRLLYVGITLNPGARWKQHSKDKPWWHEVARVTVEHFPDRETVLEAERAAIITERPLHNVVHNRGTSSDGTVIAAPQLDRLLPIQVGDWAALGLDDGRCPVGQVEAIDETWVSLRLKNFWEGVLTHSVVAVRWSEVRRVELAYPEDATKDYNGRRLMDDEHLGTFQTAWQRTHFGPDRRDPVEQAKRDVERENVEGARRR